MEESKYGSRKLMITVGMILLFVLVPLLGYKVEILKEVFWFVLVAGLAYCGTNVLALVANLKKEVAINASNNGTAQPVAPVAPSTVSGDVGSVVTINNPATPGGGVGGAAVKTEPVPFVSHPISSPPTGTTTVTFTPAPKKGKK